MTPAGRLLGAAFNVVSFLWIATLIAQYLQTRLEAAMKRHARRSRDQTEPATSADQQWENEQW